MANAVDAFSMDSHERADSDYDGVGNNADPFPNSSMGSAMFVGTCSPGVGNWRVTTGTWANDLTAAALASRTMAFVGAVADLADGWKKAGQITGREQGAIVSCAAHTK